MKMLVLLLSLVPYKFNFVYCELLMGLSLLSLMYFYSPWVLPHIMTYDFVCDKLSLSLILLSIWTLILVKNCSFKSSNVLYMTYSTLLLFLCATFLASKLMLFFVLFEASMIPTIYIIMGWGYNPEKIQALKYLVFYTVCMSMPLLIIILFLFNKSESLFLLNFNVEKVEFPATMMFVMLFMFLVKSPMFLLHSWLPKAHVEAPLVGSMLLAGVILKLGGYGLIRFASVLVSLNWLKALLLAVSSVGMILASLILLTNVDLKVIVAFSSVSHMNYLVVGLLNPTLTSESGGLFIMISHGLVSCCLFFMVSLYSNRVSSRSIVFIKGMVSLIPISGLFWFICTSLNMAFPPFFGALGEILIATLAIKLSKIVVISMFMYFFFSAFYSMMMYIMIMHGHSYNTKVSPLSLLEIYVCTLHMLPMLLIMMVSENFLML